MARVTMIAFLMLLYLSQSVQGQVRPNEFWGYPEQVWHSGMKPQMIERIGRFELMTEMQERFTPSDFARMRILASGERISTESLTYQADINLMKRMRNSSLFLIDSYLLLIRDGQIASLQEAVQIMNDERAAVEMIKPILLSQVRLDWRECPECYMEYFRVAQHSMFPDAHEAFLMMMHKFGFSELPDYAIAEYVQYVADRNLLVSLLPTTPNWLRNHSIEVLSPDEVLNRIFILPRGREYVVDGLARSGRAGSNEGGMPRAINFGAIPGTGFYQTESWEMILDKLLQRTTSVREQIRHLSLLHSQVNQSVNRELEKRAADPEYKYSRFMLAIPLDSEDLAGLRTNRIERSREILVILGGRSDVEDFEEMEPEDQLPPLQP